MKTRRNRSAQPPAKKSSARARSAARATPQTGWSSLPDEVACAVLALSSADGFGARVVLAVWYRGSSSLRHSCDLRPFGSVSQCV